MTIHQRASFDVKAAGLNATSKKNPAVAKMVAAWENKNAKRAMQGSGLALMAMSLTACGGGSSTTTAATTTTTTTTTTATAAGSAFVLAETGTTTLDNLTGTAGADTFTASGGRLNDGDAISGGAGADILTATIDASADAYIDGVETLNIKTLGASGSMNGVRIDGATNINVTGGGTLVLADAAAGIAYNVSDASTIFTLTQTGTDATTNAVSVTLGAGKLGALTLGATGGVDYETINLVLSGAGSSSLTEAGTPTFADTTDSIVVTGTGDYTLLINDGELGAHATAGSQTAAVINATGHTGKFTLDLDALTTTNNVSGASWTGVDAVRIETAAANTDVNILTKIASGTEVIVGEIEAADNELTVTPNGTATTDAITITLNDEDKGGSIDLASLTLEGFESITINSTGTDSTTGFITTVVDNSITTLLGLSSDADLNVTGDKKLTATVEASFTDIDVTNTAGSDITVAAGGALNYLGGAANDRLELDTVADLAATDVLDGGAGTDTLAFSQIPLAITAAQLGYISNFEAVEFEASNTLTAAVSLDISGEAGLNTVKFAGDLVVDDGATNTYTMTVKGVDGLTVNTGVVTNTATGNSAVMAFILDVKNAANAGTNNTVNIGAMNAGTGDIVNAGFQIDNVENLNINMLGDGDADGEDTTTITLIDGAQLTNLTVTSVNTGLVTATGLAKGSDDLIITAMETTLLSSLDASALTGDLNMVDTSAFVSTGATIKGGSAVDTITAGAGADTITGNKGADVLKGVAGNDNIDGGAGADNIDGGAGADTITGGAGDNVFVLTDGESTEAVMDIFKDFTAGAADADFDTLDMVLAADLVFNTVAKASAHDVTNHTTETETGTVGAYITNGVIKLTGTQTATVDTLAEWIDIAEDVAVNGYVDNGGSDAGAETVVAAFEFGGNTYVVMGDDADSDNTYATEVVIMLEGTTGIDAISATEALNTIHVA